MILLEEYLGTSYEPEVEFVDGRLVNRHVGEYRHSWAQGLIAAELGRREQRRYQTLIASRVRLAESRRPVPDVCVTTMSTGQVPHLAIELISDDDANEMLEKLADYHQGGIPYVWIVDPYKRTLIEGVNGVLNRPESSVLSTPLAGDVDFADLFAQLDEPAE